MSDIPDIPDHESPRARRERIFMRRRWRRRIVLGAALLLLVAGAGGFWAGYQALTRSPFPSEVPLLRADDQPTRKRPMEPGGMTVPEQDSIVLNRSEPKVEQLLPPPETPLPRPVPSEPAPGNPPQGSAATGAPPSSSGAAEPVPPAQEAQPAPGAPSAPATPGAPPPPKPPPPARTATAAPAPMPSAAGKGYRLQLGSVRTPEGARREWERLKQENGDVLGALGYSAQRVDLGERGIFYRIQAGPIADAAAAERQCSELKRRGVGCILVKP